MKMTEMIERVQELNATLSALSSALPEVVLDAYEQAMSGGFALETALLKHHAIQRPTTADLALVSRWLDKPLPMRMVEAAELCERAQQGECRFWALVADTARACGKSSGADYELRLNEALNDLTSEYGEVEIYADQISDAKYAALAAGFISMNEVGVAVVADYNRARGYDAAVLDRLVEAGVISSWVDATAERVEEWLG